MTDPWILSALSAAIFVEVVVFAVYFASEPWRKHPYGRSVMALLFAIFLFQVVSLLRQVFGAEYWGREFILGGARAIVFIALATQFYTLWRARRERRRHLVDH